MPKFFDDEEGGWVPSATQEEDDEHESSLIEQLHAAAKTNSISQLRALLLAEAPINAMDANGDTALDIAIKHDFKGAVDILLAAGAKSGKENLGFRTKL